LRVAVNKHGAQPDQQNSVWHFLASRVVDKSKYEGQSDDVSAAGCVSVVGVESSLKHVAVALLLTKVHGEP